MIHGLPVDTGEGGFRQVRAAIDDAGEGYWTWYASEDGRAAYSTLPAMFARTLRDGGELNVTVPGDSGDPPRRYVMTLPTSARAIDQTLQRCDKPLEDPRYEAIAEDGSPERMVGRDWTRAPRPVYPGRALDGNRLYRTAASMISCVALPDGRLEDCAVESEYPQGLGFGQAAVRAARGARMTPVPGARREMVSFFVRFQLD